MLQILFLSSSCFAYFLYYYCILDNVVLIMLKLMAFMDSYHKLNTTKCPRPSNIVLNLRFPPHFPFYPIFCDLSFISKTKGFSRFYVVCHFDQNFPTNKCLRAYFLMFSLGVYQILNIICIIFNFWFVVVSPGHAQGLFLALCTRVTPGSIILGDRGRTQASKFEVNLTPVLSLQHKIPIFKIFELRRILSVLKQDIVKIPSSKWAS